MKAPRTCDSTLSLPVTDDMEHRYILPQHYLFQLAERPPKDLPALLNAFRSVPPVIKRRANELLDEIRAGGSRSVGANGSRETGVGSGPSVDLKPMKGVQSDIYGEPGIAPRANFVETY